VIIRDLHINISGSMLAFYGAVVSTCTAAAQIITFLRDRVRVKIVVQRNMHVIGDARYENMALVSIQVANAGRRPFTVSHIGGAYLYPHPNFMAANSTPQLPHELTEGKHITALLDQTDINDELLSSWDVYDTLGRKHSLTAAPWYTRLKSRWNWYWERRSRRKAAKANARTP
jgi:hypothetical protein